MPRDIPLTPLYDPSGHSLPFLACAEYPTLLRAARAVAHLAGPYAGHPFRAVPPRYSSPIQFFSGAGAARGGGRWNPPGIHTVYLSADAKTTIDEALAAALHRGTPAHDAVPLTIESANVSLERVLDVRDARVIADIGFDFAELLNEDFLRLAVHRQEA